MEFKSLLVIVIVVSYFYYCFRLLEIVYLLTSVQHFGGASTVLNVLYK